MKRLIGALVVALAAVGCGGSDGTSTTEAPATTLGDSATTVASGLDTTVPTETADMAVAETVRLGYFPNVTHAPAIVGVVEGIFKDRLGETALDVKTFNAGTEAVEALFAGALDITFIGPNPAINAFAQSQGEAVRLVSGTTSGGAFLVVKPEISSVADLAGTTISTPSLGNTQDVALRAWLADEGFETTLEGGGEVSILPQGNSQILETFIAGDIDGAWVPEPWATRMILEGGGVVLVDEADLWPDGRFVTTHVLVATEFLEQYPGTVKAILEGLVGSLELIETDLASAQAAVNSNIEAITGSGIPAEVLEASWANLTFTADPVASSLQESADDAIAAELLDPVDLTGIYDLTLINEVLAEAGLEAVSE
jgi:NitT/TauT family transport system substrate-binding protein